MDVENLSDQVLNVRYLLSLRDADPHRWVPLLHGVISLSEQRCSELLAGSPLKEDETPMVCDRFGVDFESLFGSKMFFLKPQEMVRRNIRFLLGDLPHGTKKDLSSHLRVRQETISRWASGKAPPAQRHRRSILAFLGLPETVKLESVPVFLSMEPVGVFKQRMQLHRRINELKASELSRLFGALDKLLQTP